MIPGPSVDVLAVAMEVARSSGHRVRMEPASDDTGSPPLVIVQDASPSPVRNGPEGAATSTTIAVSVVARSRGECTDVADAVVGALVNGHGTYSAGRLVRARSTMLPRFVSQVVLEADGLYQKNAMLAVIARS